VRKRGVLLRAGIVSKKRVPLLRVKGALRSSVLGPLGSPGERSSVIQSVQKEGKQKRAEKGGIKRAQRSRSEHIGLRVRAKKFQTEGGGTFEFHYSQ